jgi:hypothetical protein
MTFRERWLQEADRAKGLKRLRMKRIAENPQAMKEMERKAKISAGYGAGDKVDFGAVDWQELLPVLLEFLPLILKLFGL